MDLFNLTFSYIIQALAVIIILYETFKKIMEIKSKSDEDHDRRQSWDKAAKVIEEKADLWDKGLADMEAGRKRIVAGFDERLDGQDAKIQDLLNMLVMVLQAQDAILEALIEQGIGNGEIKATRKELSKFVSDQIKGHDNYG